MEKKILLLTLLLLLMPCIVLAQETTNPLWDIIVTTGEDSYRIETPSDSVELFLYKSDQEIQCENPYIIPRTDEWQHYIFSVSHPDEWGNIYSYQRYISVPPFGQELPPSPEIIVTNNGNQYSVTAVSNYIETGDNFNDLVFGALCPWGEWVFMYPDEPFTINREDEEQVYWFKAYNSINGPEYWDFDTFWGLQSQEVRQKVVIPAKEQTPDPVITVTPANKYYTVTVTGDGYISVSLNGSHKGSGTNSYQFTINRVNVDKNYKIEATAHDSQKKISNKVTLDLVVPALEKTPTPQIIVTPSDLTYTVEAVGVGQVYLEFNQMYPKALDNPYVINRYYEDEVYSFRAYALEEDKQISDYAYLDLVVPAAAVTPSPEITFTEDQDGCLVKATGEGTVCLYYKGEEVDNPYKIMRPYQTRSITFSASAVANGKLKSEPSYYSMAVTAEPSFEYYHTNKNDYFYGNQVDTVFIKSDDPGDAWYYNLQPEKIQAKGNGNIRLFIDSVEVENPYFLDGRGKAISQSYRVIATAKEDGKLTGQKERIYIFPPSPSPESSHFVQITSDDDNYYLTAEKNGYITLSCGSKAKGKNSVTLSRARPDNTFYTQYPYMAVCVDSINNAITCDKGKMHVVGTKFNKMKPIVLVWASEDEYKISAHHSFWLSQDNSDGDHIESGAMLMRNGQQVDNPYFIHRSEYDQVFNDFSAALTIELQHYTQIAPGSTFVETKEVLEVSNNLWQEPVVVAAGGDDFYVRQEIDGLKYYANIKGNEYGYVMHHAYVQENQEFVGDAIIPDFVDCFYMEMWDKEPYLVWVNGVWGWEWDDKGWGGSTFDVGGSCPVTEIADSAFYANKQLTGITLGKNLSLIGNRAFADCSNLNYVKCFSIQPPKMEAETCFDCYKKATLWVPNGSANRYKTTEWWNKFDDIKEFDIEVPHGDVNCDGEIGISDINALIDLILSDGFNSIGDINNDGEISISDINALIDIILE